MSEWLLGGLLTAGVAIVSTIGVVIGHLVSSRTAKQAAAVQADTAARNDSQELIDQLQEELGRYRDAHDARATAMDARMNRLETYSDGYRNHAHQLRSHIWDGNPPPPPEWPEDLPR